MELLNSIGLSEADVRKISPETADSIAELDSLSTYALAENAPQNIKEAYKSLSKQIESYLFSTKFRMAAKKAGLKVSSGLDVDEEIVIAEIPKVKSISERIAERKSGKAKEVEEVEEAAEVKEIEEPIVAPIEEIEEVEEIEEIEEVEETADVLFGVLIKGDKSGEMTGRELFSTMLAYGRSDYILGMFEDSKGYHYRLDLPLSMGQVVFSFGTAAENSSHSSLLSVWKSYTEDNSASINLVSRSENQLEQLSNVLGFTSVTKERVPLSSTHLRDEKFDKDSYSIVNDVYARGLEGQIYYDLAKSIKISWEDASPLESGGSASLVHGINFGDYIYEDAERLYKKGGYSIVAKKYTFYVPKGLTKDNVFAEIGLHLKELPIKTSKFEKDIAIGKRFQVSTGDFDEALSCRIVGSSANTKGDNILYVVDENGHGYKISKVAYNYFRHYYGVETDIKISKETLVVYQEGSVVGLITANKYSSVLIGGMFDYENFKKELRTIDADAYDFMVSEKVAVEEETAVEIKEIEEEVEEEVEKKEEGKIEEGDLKTELTDRIEFLDELYEESVEDGDNQDLIDELDMELETLRDLLEDIE